MQMNLQHLGALTRQFSMEINEPRLKKTGFLHIRKQSRKSAAQ